MNEVFAHEVPLWELMEKLPVCPSHPITRTELWSAVRFVLLHRPEFCELFQKVVPSEPVSDDARSAKLKVQLQGDSWIEEEVTFTPDEKILIRLPGTRTYPSSSTEIEILEDKERFTLRFTYSENLEEKKSLGISYPPEIEALRHQAWQMKDEEIVSGVIKVLGLDALKH